MKAVLLSRRQIAARTIEVSFELAEKIDLIAGQSFRLIIPGGESRFFSALNPTGRTNVISTAMRVRDTKFKKNLANAPLGVEFDVSSIAGAFLLPENGAGPFVFIAGGIGAVPFASMLRAESARQSFREITLIYSNSDDDSLAFGDELAKLAEREPHFKLILQIGKKIGESQLKKFRETQKGVQYLISGPPLMVNDLYNILIALGVTPKNIKTEEFTGY